MKKLPTPKKTKKKFYNKYIYKITLDIPGTSSLRWYDFPQLLELCLGSKLNNRDNYAWRERVISDVLEHSKTWINLAMMLSTFDAKTFSKRIEGESLDFYTNDFDLYSKIGNSFADFVRMRYEPKEGTEQTLLTSEKVIFVNKLPHNKYQYRAYLKPYKLEQNSKTSIAAWMEKQQPKITFTKSIKSWFISNAENWDRRYIHIQDEHTLLMIQLRAPQLIGKVFKYTLNR